MIKAICFKCKNELNEPGAILWSDPEGEKEPMSCDKYHLCVRCFQDVILYVSGQRHLEDDPMRASGDCLCPHCYKTYKEHQDAWDYLDSYSEPYLKRLCDGRLVKL